LLAHVNPYIVYSSGYTVSACLTSMALLAMHVPLASLSSWRPIPQQKSILLLETYALWWILLVFDTVLVDKNKVGGFYIITFFHVASFLALLVTLVEHLRLPSARHQSFDEHEGAEAEEHGEENHTETTPLIRRRQDAAHKADAQEGEHYAFWIVEYLLLVPFPVILVAETAIMLLGALPQTLADGNSSLLVYLVLALISFLLVFPLAPFTHKVHRSVGVGLLLILLGTGLYSFVAFPFSRASPLKVFFYQSVDLDTGINHVNLTGLAGYVDTRIIPELPSTWNRSVVCSDSPQRIGLRTCQWEGLVPAVVPNKRDWLTFNATLAAPGTALIKLKGTNTRSCRIYFDHPVTSIRVDNSTGEVQSDYPLPSEGVTELLLWSRTWNREFAVTAGWQGEESLNGRVSCGWAESLEGRIPAFAEVIGFLPEWVHVTKANDALVEATQKFSV